MTKQKKIRIGAAILFLLLLVGGIYYFVLPAPLGELEEIVEYGGVKIPAVVLDWHRFFDDFDEQAFQLDNPGEVRGEGLPAKFQNQYGEPGIKRECKRSAAILSFFEANENKIDRLTRYQLWKLRRIAKIGLNDLRPHIRKLYDDLYHQYGLDQPEKEKQWKAYLIRSQAVYRYFDSHPGEREKFYEQYDLLD
ncbi:MAG: hypothetical protein Q4P65_03090 [Eubacteriales bacterium]|nr:hypothetical protein [Eubacteriales bacterium]